MNFNIPNGPLKGIFFIHFMLSVWALQPQWLPPSYMYYNLIFLGCLVWCLHNRDSEEPVFMAIAINVVSILLDVILVSIYYDRVKDVMSHNEVRFSCGMFVINLLLRPATSILLLKLYNERVGRFSNLGFPGFGIGAGRGPYEDIDQSTQSVPKSAMDTGSPIHDHLSDSHIPPYPPTQ